MIDIPDIQRKYSPEMAFVILICRVFLRSAQPGDIKDFTSKNAIDYKIVWRIITAHQVRPLIYKVLSVHNSGIDEEFLAKLRTKCFQIATGNMQKLEELARLNKLFSANGIINFPYKGVILSQFLFDDYISRETADIDFIINPQDFAKAYEALIMEGYTPRYYNPDFEKQFLRTSHELMFAETTSSGVLKAEIHWAATNVMMNIPLPNRELFANPQTVRIKDFDIETFNMQYQLLVLLVHHGVNDIWRTLRHTLDISLFLEKQGAGIDWDEFRKATIKYKIRHTTEAGFLISQELFGTKIPGNFSRENALPDSIYENLLRFPPVKKRKLNNENLQQQLFLRDSFADKVRLLLSYMRTGVTPNVRDMEAYPVGRNWYLLYYLIKPYRILSGKFKGGK